MSLLTPAVVLFLVAFAVLASLAVWRRALFRIAVRNFVRHRSTSALVVGGLLIGTALLAGGAVMADSISFFIVRDIYQRLDLVDVQVEPEGGGLFNDTVFRALQADPSVDAASDGVAPALITPAAVENLDRGQFEPLIVLHGFDPVADAELGAFALGDGSRTFGEGLNASSVLANERAASALDARRGDRLRVVLPRPGSPVPRVANLYVADIVSDSGKGGFGGGPNLFLRLDSLQSLLNVPGKIGLVKLSALGDVQSGADSSPALQGEAKRVLAGLAASDAAGLSARAVKKDGLDAVAQAAEGFRGFVWFLGSFTIIAGVILIINIFTMLAEERKSELGMARAVGMLRRKVVQLFLFEGFTYAIAAAAAGVLVGILVGLVLVFAVSSAFASQIGPISFEVVIRPTNMVDSFALGSLLTFGTILFAAYRLSRVNIVRAIRDIPEPVAKRSGRRLAVVSAVVVGLSAFAAFRAWDTQAIRLLAPAIGLLAAGPVLNALLSKRVSYSGSATATLVYVLYTIPTFQTPQSPGEFTALFVGSGLIIVLSACVLTMINADVLVGVLSRGLGRSRGWRALAKLSTAHAVNRRFRTGMTVSMFSLVLYIITVLSVFGASFASADVNTEIRRQAAGFEILGTSLVPADLTNLDVDDGTGRLVHVDSRALREHVEAFAQAATLYPALLADGQMISPGGAGSSGGGQPGGPFGSPTRAVLGVDASFPVSGQVDVGRWAPGYDASRAWAEVASGRATIVESTFVFSDSGGMDVVRLGTVLTLNGTSGPRSFPVVGILEFSVFRGAFVSRDAFRETFAGSPMAQGNTTFFFRAKSGIDVVRLTLDLERDFRGIGMNTVNLRTVIENGLAGSNAFFLLFQGFLGLGLVVGIASLGVIAARSVIERKLEIGVMRALGYRRPQVVRSFLLESLFITSLGVAIGLTVGLLFAYQLFRVSDFQGVVFRVPWTNLLIILGITYAASLVSTLGPALRASRMRPVDALRFVG